MPLSSLYKLAINARNLLYDKGVFGVRDLGKPVISVGNITVGGTGKTPLTAFVAKVLAEAGENVCILTRGYGRKNPKQRVVVSDGRKVLADVNESGDEPFELAHELVGKAAVIADANRYAAGKWRTENLGATVFILDDGFQHRKLRRDLDIVTIDATNPFGNGKPLPFGRLREPLENLSRADALVITRSNLAEPEEVDGLCHKLRGLHAAAPIFLAEDRIGYVTNLKNLFVGDNVASETLGNEPLYAFCGLGNPTSFFESATQVGLNLAAAKVFRDHHKYSQEDVEMMEIDAASMGARGLITTRKDAVKLAELKFRLPCYVAISELIFPNGSEFKSLILAVVSK